MNAPLPRLVRGYASAASNPWLQLLRTPKVELPPEYEARLKLPYVSNRATRTYREQVVITGLMRRYHANVWYVKSKYRAIKRADYARRTPYVVIE